MELESAVKTYLADPKNRRNIAITQSILDWVECDAPYKVRKNLSGEAVRTLLNRVIAAADTN